jgi:hypothetical protein
MTPALHRPWSVQTWEPRRLVVFVKGWTMRQLLFGALWLLPFVVPLVAFVAPELARPYLPTDDDPTPGGPVVGLLLFCCIPGTLGALWIAGARPRRTEIDWQAGIATDGKRVVRLGDVTSVELALDVVGGQTRSSASGPTAMAQRSYKVRLLSAAAKPVELIGRPVAFLELVEVYESLVPLARALGDALRVPTRMARPPLE